MIRVGIIGFGKMGHIRAKAVEKSGLGRVISVYDENVNNISGYNKESSIDNIINNPDIDAIFVCTPNNFNKQYTIRSLEAGKHVFCEKPPAFNADEVLEIQKIEKKSLKKLMYGLNHRYHDSVIKMKNIIDSGDFGKTLWMRGRYGKSVDGTFFNNWRSKKKLAGGGILMDQGIHMVDLFLHLSGVNFDNIHAVLSNRYWKIEVEDNAFVIFEDSETGIVASLHSTMTQWRHIFSLEVFMEKGYMVLNGLKTSTNSYGDEILSIAVNRSKSPAAIWDNEEKYNFKVDNSWDNEIVEFFDAIINNRSIISGNSNDALNIMLTIDEIYNKGNSKR